MIQAIRNAAPAKVGEAFFMSLDALYLLSYTHHRRGSLCFPRTENKEYFFLKRQEKRRSGT
jgi:hypothetical protein